MHTYTLMHTQPHTHTNTHTETHTHSLTHTHAHATPPPTSPYPPQKNQSFAFQESILAHFFIFSDQIYIYLIYYQMHPEKKNSFDQT